MALLIFTSRRWRRRACVAFALGMLLLAAHAGAQPERSAPEQEVKAAAIYNFTAFVTWPPSAFAAPDAPLVIGILGRDPFGRTIDDLVRGETAQGRPIVVQRCNTFAEAQSCHLLFVGRAEGGRIDQLLSAMRHRPILTVSDSDNFARRGGAVQLLVENGRLRLIVNVSAAREANVNISSKLLRLAEVVGDQPAP